MKKGLKALLLVMCAIVLVVATVFTTLAYMTKKAEITNTFTVGNLDITLLETDVDEYGEAIENAQPVNTNEYKLIPGHVYAKDPYITVVEDSESCFVYATIDNGLKDYTKSIALNTEGGWSWLDDSQTIAVYKEAVETIDKDNMRLPSVFTQFETLETADFTGEFNPTEYTIKITGYAVQADGFNGDPEAAWAATFGKSTEA